MRIGDGARVAYGQSGTGQSQNDLPHFPQNYYKSSPQRFIDGGLRLSTPKQDGHGSLRGSSYQSVIPYVHGENCYIAAFGVVQAWS
jgi:hypothetical protein